MQNFLPNSEEVAKIRDCILFDKKKLSELYARVGELLRETNDELNKYKYRHLKIILLSTNFFKIKS